MKRILSFVFAIAIVSCGVKNEEKTFQMPSNVPIPSSSPLRVSYAMFPNGTNVSGVIITFSNLSAQPVLIKHLSDIATFCLIYADPPIFSAPKKYASDERPQHDLVKILPNASYATVVWLSDRVKSGFIADSLPSNITLSFGVSYYYGVNAAEMTPFTDNFTQELSIQKPSAALREEVNNFIQTENSRKTEIIEKAKRVISK